MPLNTLLLSAAYPSGPVTWEASPFAPARVIARIESAAFAALAEPFSPVLTATRVCIALPSAEPIGPTTWPGTAPCIEANRRAPAGALPPPAPGPPAGRGAPPEPQG